MVISYPKRLSVATWGGPCLQIPPKFSESLRSFHVGTPVLSRGLPSLLTFPGVGDVVLEATDGAADGHRKPIRAARDKTIHLQNSYVSAWEQRVAKTTARGPGSARCAKRLWPAGWRRAVGRRTSGGGWGGAGGTWKREPREADGEEDRARETRRGLGRNAETASDAPPGKPRARSEGGRLGLVDSRWTATEHFLSVRGSARLRYYVPVSRELNLLADGSPCWRNGRAQTQT